MSARHTFAVSLLATTALAASPAFAQVAGTEQTAKSLPGASPESDDLTDEVIVTAQKREENIQNVPISIQALGTRKLDQLNVSNFKDYAQLLPSVTFQALGGTPGTNVVYMRGVASGGDGNHSGSLPSVGVYLDEQPVTTIGGNLDVHIYDIARIESLAGPQGTLYGASSEAGTIRIITNKPDHSGFYGRVDGEVNTIRHGDMGGKIEGMINAPFNDWAALRVVGFYERDGGYIDNVPGRRDFIAPAPAGGGEEDAGAGVPAGSQGALGTIVRPDGGISVTNDEFVKKNYNDVTTYGGRAALKIDLDDEWTATPTVLYQKLKSKGAFGYDPSVGDLEVQHFYPEYRRDRFIQAALTIEGKVGNWDLTYAGAYLDRKDIQSSDYTDYAEAYDSLYSSVGGLANYFYYKDNAGNQIDPRQNVIGTDHFKKLSQELRVASPQSEPFRVVAGAFFQRQSNLIHQDYKIPGLADALSVNGFPGTLWLTQQHRVDRDYAMFGEASFDFTPRLTLTAGARAYIYKNSLIGFFGFGRNPGNGYSDSPPNAAGSNRTGVAQCFTTSGERLYDRDTDTYSSSLTLLPPAVAGGPCTNLARYVNGGLRPVVASGQGVTHRLNLTWKPQDGLMVYGTWSRGFRPGGINRRADTGPYAADFLTNYEIGAKATTLDGRLRINGAIYRQDWKKFQFSFLGQNSFTEIHNGPDARIWGAEVDANLSLGALSLSASGSYTDAKTRKNLCAIDDPTFTCADVDGNGNFIAAPKGTRLPVTPKVKVNGSARYTFDLGSAKPYLQGVVAYQSSAASDIRQAVVETGTGDIVSPAELTGRLKAFTTANFAAGVDFGNYTLEAFIQNAFDVRGQLSRFQECGSCYQRPYIVTITPRTIGVRAGAKF